jgi:hypothetical protein
MGEHSGCVALGPEAADYVGSHFWLSLVGRSSDPVVTGALVIGSDSGHPPPVPASLSPRS